MIIQCNSCKKKFSVPDAAITSKGRLVQCSSCGNQWTQYPPNQNLKKTTKTGKLSKPISTSKQKRKKEKTIDTYSEEYLQKKHGIKIIDPSSLSKKPTTNKLKTKRNYKSYGFGFYNSLLISIIFLIFILGILNLTRDILVYNYPFLENYINYLFETLNNIKLIISDFITDY